MKQYLCRLDWSVLVDANCEQEAVEKAWEIYEDTINISMVVEED